MPRTPAKVTQDTSGAVDVSTLSPHIPMSLDEAASLLLRGLVKASTLRAAADRGELAVERLGRRIVTTPADIAAWREKCRDHQKGLASTSSRPDGQQTLRNGSLETDEQKLALDAAKATALALKSGLRNTSPRNTGRPAASVHYLKPE